MESTSRLARLRMASDSGMSKRLRANMTDAERALWYRLRAKRLGGWKFRRRVPVGSYVADFLCERASVIVELDGGQHPERMERDAMRTEWTRRQGYEVVRFWNNDVLGNMDRVLDTLARAF